MPTKEFSAELPKNAIEEFWERGFTRFDRVTTDEELDWFRDVYDLLFSGEVKFPKGTLVNDINRPYDQQRGQVTSQLLYPETFYPSLRKTLFYRNTQRMARQLFDDAADLRCWSHMARKAPRNDEPLGWHQDEAYWDPTFEHQAAAFWMPLDPATRESGAMSFIPGSHKGDVLRCSFPENDPTLTVMSINEEFDKSKAVLQPVPIGGVSIHHGRILHTSGPNQTDNPRRAYINVWSRPPAKREVPYERPWYWQKVMKNSTTGVSTAQRKQGT